LASDDPQAVAAAADLVRQAGFVPVVVPLARGGEFGPGLKFGVGAYTVAEWKAKFGL
jgi:predicted dinucleotide-binding enzyme